MCIRDRIQAETEISQFFPGVLIGLIFSNDYDSVGDSVSKADVEYGGVRVYRNQYKWKLHRKHEKRESKSLEHYQKIKIKQYDNESNSSIPTTHTVVRKSIVIAYLYALLKIEKFQNKLSYCTYFSMDHEY